MSIREKSNEQTQTDTTNWPDLGRQITEIDSLMSQSVTNLPRIPTVKQSIFKDYRVGYQIKLRNKTVSPQEVKKQVQNKIIDKAVASAKKAPESN